MMRLWEQAAQAFGRYVGRGGEGDVLVFMPGAFEIARTIEAIGRRPEARGFLRLPLHGELAPRDQDAAVARYQQRKVVVSTNVAETSLTIDGVRLVIDSGLARIPRFDPYRGINTLLIDKISRSRRAETMRDLREQLGVSEDQMLATSAQTREGIPALLDSIEAFIHSPIGGES